jgi:geranylgeranyl pyrophosphate synthase
MVNAERGWLDDPATCDLIKFHLHLVGEEIQRDLQAHALPSLLVSILTQALKEPGKLLSRPLMQGGNFELRDLRGWAVVSLLTAISVALRSSSPPDVLSLDRLPDAVWERARWAAMAMEYAATAIDLADDVQDGDTPWVSSLGAGTAGIATTALLQLSHLALWHLRSPQWPAALALAAEERLSEGIIHVMGGQYQDLLYERQDAQSLTEDQILEMTGNKSGALLGLACELGALAGSPHSQPEYCQELLEFGYYLGVWAQLINDLHGAETGGERSDRARGKKTLPLWREALDAGHQPPAETSDAHLYTFVVAETFRVRAQHRLESLDQKYGPHQLLWPFLVASYKQPGEAM